MKITQSKQYFCICFFSICFSTTIIAQKVFHPEQQKVNIYNTESERLQEKNTDSALYYSLAALKTAKEIKYKQGALTAINNTGWIYYRKGDYQTSIKYAFDAISLAEKLKNFNELAKSYNTIGSVYNDQDIVSSSIDFFYQSLFAYKKANNQIGIGRALNNLAYTYFKSKKLDSALYISRQAYSQNSMLQDKYFFAFTLRTMSDIYKAKGNIVAASEHLFEALNYAQLSQKHFLIISILNRLGSINEQKNNKDSAIWYYKRSEKLANEYGFRSILIQPYEGLAKLYSKGNDFRNAFIYQSAFSKLNDSLKNAETTETISRLQLNFERIKKESEINLLKKEKDLQAIRVKKQQQFILTLIIIVLIIGAFLVFLFRRYNFEKKYSHKIIQQADELGAANKLLTENLSFKTKMLSILSHDLRSPLGTLSAMIQLLDMDALSPSEYQSVKQKIVKQLKVLNITLDNLLNWALTRTSSFIKPLPKKTNLSELVDNNIRLFEALTEEKKILFECELSPNVLVLADQDQLNVVIRNLLLNAIKFSLDNGKIDISTSERSDTISLIITDHGIGIPVEKQKYIFSHDAHFTSLGTHNEKGTGLGLLLCKEFIERNNGEIGFESYPSKGSSFYFSLPKFEG